MKARRVSKAELEDGHPELPFADSEQQELRFPIPNTIDDAAVAADEMAAKSAVLVEMMEDLEEQLRRRMANLNDPTTAYVRKVRRFQSMVHSENDPMAAVSASRQSEQAPSSTENRSRIS